MYKRLLLFELLYCRLGLNPKTFTEIVNSSTGRCWSSEIYNPVPGICMNAPANNDYKGGFSTELITKVNLYTITDLLNLFSI